MNKINSEDQAVYNISDDDETIRLAMNIIIKRLNSSSVVIGNPDDTLNFLKLRYDGQEYETFDVMFLDNRHRLIKFKQLFRGTIDGASVYPREVVKEALKHNAAALIVSHNHPSGIPEPSQSDENITNRLKDALNLMDIRLLDHIIIGGSDHVSLAERGLL